MKNHFHIKGWALNLILIQRPGGTWKWPIVLPPRPPTPNNIYTPTMDTLCARDFSCTVSSFSQVFIVTHAKSFFLRIVACDFSLQPNNLSAWRWHARKNLWYPGQSWRNYSIEIPAPPPPCPNNTTITPLKIPHWVMFTLNNRELKQKHFWETHVTWKWGFSLDCAFRCYKMFIVTGLSLRGGGWGFPLATMNMAVATFIAKQTKNRTKRNP